jgi:hypothetical protein
VELIGIDQGTVNVEDESEHGDKGELRRSIEQAHVLELNRLSIMKCADPRRNLIISGRSGMATVRPSLVGLTPEQAKTLAGGTQSDRVCDAGVGSDGD